MKWQPIETAPKDGTEFIGFGTYPDHDETPVEYMHVAHFSGDYEHPWEINDGDFVSPCYFTHWMPLPEPPKD